MAEDKQEAESRVGLFIQRYSGFLSSFVIGMAGLVATSIWQFRQGQIAERQAYSQEQIATEKAKNDWKIARAEILSKNLDVLAKRGADFADQKYGVLLSLTRGEMIDPELAVSYALELGRDSPEYMSSILASAKNKSYAQLARAFALTCLQRFGVERAAEICRDDTLGDRSAAIAEVIKDEMDTVDQLQGDPRRGPMALLADEDEVQHNAPRISWLFEPYLQALYERRRWKDIDRFEAFSPGARLVAALTFSTARTGELLSTVETQQVEAFHSQRRRWLMDYILRRSCDPDCRASLVEFMLATVEEASGDYDQTLKEILIRPRAETGHAVDQIHTRLLWCQIDPDDLALLRDRVLVPTVREVIKQPPKDPAIADDLVSLFALTAPPTDAAALDAYDDARASLKTTDRLEKLFLNRQARALRQRQSPPPMIKRVSFCGVAAPDESVR